MDVQALTSPPAIALEIAACLTLAQLLAIPNETNNMRIPLTSWLLLIGVASAVTESTQVFIRDPESSTHQPIFDGIVRPDTAKLIFSRRLGFSHLYSLSGCDAHSIQQIDDLGGPQPQPFSLGKNHDKSRILLVVEGVAKADDLLPSSVGHLGRFEVKPAPHRKGTGQLVDEFLTEAERHPIENASEYFRSKALEKLSIHLENKIETRNGRSIVHITSMTVRIVHAIYQTRLMCISRPQINNMEPKVPNTRGKWR
jgi:hypothetical protein